MSFSKDLRALLNRHSRENASDTPDFILSEYIETCLGAYEVAVTRRDAHNEDQPPAHDNEGDEPTS